MHVDVALLQKYSKPGPRYTSYPTAPYFTEAYGEKEWREELARSQETGRGISLYAHIPFCDTLCYYCGCNMVATGHYEKASHYLELLLREIDHSARLINPARKVEQLHWGGGTPTYLNPADMRLLASHMRSLFDFSPTAEVGCEVDPRELSEDHVQALLDSGFNRVSLGVQDLDANVQKAVNRVQSEELIRRVYGWMRDAGFSSINMDLMVGLPHQTVTSFSRTLDAILDMAPDRLAVFSYAHVPWMKKHQTLIVEADLPDLAHRLQLQQLIFERLTEAGYEYVGMDHFARPDDEMVQARKNGTLYRNFQGYTTHRDCDILAYGASAISQTDSAYMQNLKKIPAYETAVGEGRLPVERGLTVQPEDRMRRDLISRIMCDLVVDAEQFGQLWRLDFYRTFAAAIEQFPEFVRDGLIQWDGRLLQVTMLGRIFLRNIAMLFDAYLAQEQADKPRYSKTL